MIGTIAGLSCSTNSEKSTPSPAQTIATQGSTQDTPLIKVLSAIRTRRYITGDRLITATNSREEILLVIEITGIPASKTIHIVDEVSKKIGKLEKEGKLYLMAGEQRCDITYRSIEIVGSEPKVTLVASVPQKAIEIRLFLGDHPSIIIEAQKNIQRELKHE